MKKTVKSLLVLKSITNMLSMTPKIYANLTINFSPINKIKLSAINIKIEEKKIYIKEIKVEN